MISSESGVKKSDSTEEGLARLLDEINGSVREETKANRGVVEGADVAARDKPVECWLDGDEFAGLLSDYALATDRGTGQELATARNALHDAIRANVGRILG